MPVSPGPVTSSVPSIRQKFFKWSLRRFLHRARRGLVRNPSADQVRHDMALFDRTMRGREAYTLGEAIDLGHCPGHWLDAGGQDEGRVVLFLHGGAFVAESPIAHCSLLARLCRQARARGFYVAYRLAPEHPYPAAADDCLDAYRYLLAQGVAASRIVIAGDSAGGGLTVTTAMRIRDLGLPAPAGMILISPLLDLTFSGKSVRRNDGLDPLFRAPVVDALGPIYVPGGDVQHPYVSPLFGDVAGLPPALVLVGSSEILLDDSVRFAERADDADLQVWHDMPHIFPILDRLDEARMAVEEMAAFVASRIPVSTAANPPAVSPGG
jgi:monoterpene epsilon-lactone hydrolase